MGCKRAQAVGGGTGVETAPDALAQTLGRSAFELCFRDGTRAAERRPLIEGCKTLGIESDLEQRTGVDEVEIEGFGATPSRVDRWCGHAQRDDDPLIGR